MRSGDVVFGYDEELGRLEREERVQISVQPEGLVGVLFQCGLPCQIFGGALRGVVVLVRKQDKERVV